MVAFHRFVLPGEKRLLSLYRLHTGHSHIELIRSEAPFCVPCDKPLSLEHNLAFFRSDLTDSEKSAF